MKKILSVSRIASLAAVASITFTLNLAAFAIVSILTAGSAGAIVLNGAVTGGSAFNQGGIFVELNVPFGGASTPADSVGNNNFQTPNLYAFDEDQNILLPNILNVNVGSNVPANQIVASHYVFFDPLNNTSITGFVDFDAPIVGVATSRVNLNASDVLQNNSVTYLSPSLRGLEGGDSVQIIDAIGGIFTAGNNQRLLINWTASSPGDYVRVFTQESPGAPSVVPIPAALPLYGTAIALMGFVGWRRKQRKVAV